MEEVVATYLEDKHGMMCEVSDGRFPYWDIIIGGETYEVKADRLADKTGNMFVETKNPKTGRRKGIYESTADYYVYCTGTNVMFFDRGALIDYIETKDVRIVEAYSGNAEGALVRIEDVQHLILLNERLKGIL